jgi:peptidoglycan-associated lipoprotein
MIKRILKLIMILFVSFIFTSCTLDRQDVVLNNSNQTALFYFTPPTRSTIQGGEDQVYYILANSTYIQLKDRPSIIAQAKYLRDHPASKALLIGNTDTCGSQAYNFALGWQYAQGLANILLAQGVLPKQINVVSYGKENPIDLWHNKEAGSLNRRVVLHYYENS